MEVFRHLQADESGSHHQGVFHPAVVHQSADPVRIRNGPEGVNRRMIETGNRRLYRRTSGGEEQLIVGFIVFPTRGQLFDPDLFLTGSDGQHLVTSAHLDVEQFLEPCGALQQQPSPLGDRIADVVRQAAVGIRNIIAPFKHDDFCSFVKSFEPCCRRHAGGNAANDKIFCHWILQI